MYIGVNVKKLMIILVILLVYTCLIPLTTSYEQLNTGNIPINTEVNCSVVPLYGGTTIDNAVYKHVLPEHTAVIRKIIWVESRGDSTAVSTTGDYGIMQVNKKCWGRRFDFNRMLELEYGLLAGYEVFKICLDTANGDIRLALKLYNGSWSYVDRVERLKEEEICFK